MKKKDIPVEFVFQLLYAPSEGRLGQPEAVGGLGDSAGVRYRYQ